MLYELANYARKNNIPGKPGFKSKKARWSILLSENGSFIDILEENRSFKMCPHLEQNELIAGGAARSHLLLDTFSIVTGIDADEKALMKHQFFIHLLNEGSVYEPTFKICLQYLNNKLLIDKTKEKAKSLKIKPTDNITFRVGNTYPIELTSWHEWWGQFRASLVDEKKNTPPMVCLMSGNIVRPAPNHYKISGLTSVGGQASGTVLIGFDKDSFTSYGLEQSLNAACSEEAAAIYRNALDDLIAKAPKQLAGTMFLHWYKEPVNDDDDILKFDDFDTGKADEASARIKVERLFKSIHEGKRPELLQNRYYILQVSAEGGRIMVRDWLCGDFINLVQKIRKWFDDLSLVSPDGRGLAQDFKLSAALIRLVDFRPNERINQTFERIDKELSPIMPQLWRCILQDLPIMDVVAEKSLRYIRSSLLNSVGDSMQSDINLDRIACSLLKAWIIRKHRTRGGEGVMKQGLNPNHLSPAYQAGRMMAVLAALQQSALGDVGAGVIQRYYAAASTTPALVLGRLTRLAQYHLEKVNKGLAVWYEKTLSSIAEKMGDSIPTTLTLEEQALFALGYYQQKAEMTSVKQQNKEIGMDIEKED